MMVGIILVKGRIFVSVMLSLLLGSVPLGKNVPEICIVSLDCWDGFLGDVILLPSTVGFSIKYML